MITAFKISIIHAQSLDQIGKVPLLKVGGSISANGTYYEGTANRDPFSFNVNGNLNFNISGLYNIPLSFSYTSQSFSYNTPFKINRLSIHPSYKWITTHIGDVNMTFSPYTVSGHQFTGAGVDATPNGPFRISALYGRFLRATEYDNEFPAILPVYERYGYGIKSSYSFRKLDVELIFFKAKDKPSSLTTAIPLELGVTPKENLVVSLKSGINLIKNLSFNFEIAQSAVTENIDSPTTGENSNLLGFLIDEKTSTDFYKAYNANFSYTLFNGSVGVGYERIDPGYRTFGAYFFNNDLENITLNASQNLFKSKLSLSVNAGLQRDDLKNEKETQLQRVVSSVNASLIVSEKVDINASYSNFQSYTNIRNQFDEINQIDELNSRDTLNFTQISQNASLGGTYKIMNTEDKRQGLSAQLNYQTSKEDSGDLNTNSSDFYNGSTTYTIEFPNKSLQYNGAMNFAYNQAVEESVFTYGPTLSVRKRFFDKTLSTGLSSSYNITSSEGEIQNEIFSNRFTAQYSYQKRHNFSFSAIFLLRKAVQRVSNDLTIRLGYAYSFDVKRPKLKFGKRDKTAVTEEKQKEKRDDHFYRFRYRDIIYKGYANDIISQLLVTSKKEYLRDSEVFGRTELLTMLSDLKERKNPLAFQDNAITYLENLYQYIDFAIAYKEKLVEVWSDLKVDTKKKDEEIQMSFRIAKFKMERNSLHKMTPSERSNMHKDSIAGYAELVEEHQKQSEKYDAHHYITNRVFEINNKKNENKKEIEDIRLKAIRNTFEIYKSDGSLLNSNEYLEGEIVLYLDMEYRARKQFE